MNKRKYLYILLAIVVSLYLVPIVVSAQPGGFTSWVSINMTGSNSSYLIIDRMGATRFKIDTSATTTFAPTGLILAMTGPGTVTINWTAGLGSCYSMVRAAIGHVPTSRTDGYLVYYGPAETATDYINEEETVFYRVWAQGCDTLWEETGIWDSIGGATLVLLAILAFCAIISFIAMRSSFFGLKLIAGMSWFGFFIYFKDHPPSVITEGSGAHWALLIIAIGFGLMIVLAGLGRGIEQTRDRTGAFSTTSVGGFKFQLPKFLTNSGEEHQAQRKQDIDDYRERMHRALNPREKERK